MQVKPLPTRAFDFVVVGGGTAGCVLANRLTENPETRVLLLEAGNDFLPGQEPSEVLSLESPSSFMSAYRWRLPARHVRDGSMAMAHQAKIMGGGSTIMGMVALRGTALDYDSWNQDYGASGWAWSDVLPFFNRVETDIDIQGPLHGADGPTSILRVATEHWGPLSRQVGAWAESRGIPWSNDLNAGGDDGYGQIPSFSDGNRRQSSSICYLSSAVRARSNLTIRSNAEVHRLFMHIDRDNELEVLLDGAYLQRVHAHKIVLASGALLTPALLMRSGIGPASKLATLGIPIVTDLPGVGSNLQNHPMLFMSAFMKRDARQPASQPLGLNACMRYSSGLPGCPGTDLYMAAFNKTAPNALGRSMALLHTYLLQPASRGEVRLTHADPATQPIVEFRMLDDERDVLRSILSLKHMAELAEHQPIKAMADGPFFCVGLTDRLRSLNEPTRKNLLRSAIASMVRDLLPLPGKAVRRLIGAGPVSSEVIATQIDLRDHVRRNVSASGHHAGTCRMGAPDDAYSVVDATGAVHGIPNLYVGDASIMPVIPRGNTNLPTLMIAEKVAARLKSQSA